MKYNYCPECDKAYLKSRLEKDRCIFCGKPCEAVDVKRSRRYYLGYGTMVLGAVVTLIIRIWFYDVTLLWLAGIFFILVGGIIVLDANSRMAKSAAAAARSGREKGKD